MGGPLPATESIGQQDLSDVQTNQPRNRKRAFLVVLEVEEAVRRKLVRKGVAGRLVSIKDFYAALTKCLGRHPVPGLTCR